MTIATVAIPTLNGAQAALAVQDTNNILDVVIEKMDITINGQTVQITSSADYDATLDRVWETFAPGALGGSFNCEAKVRTGVVTGLNIFPSFMYRFYPFIVRPTNAAPLGKFFAFNALVEKSDFTCDPKSGVIDWKMSCKISGPVVYPV